MDSKILLAVFCQKNNRNINKLLDQLETLNHHILIIDDGVCINPDILRESSVQYILHSNPLGSGGCFLSALQYARDYNYEILITMNNENDSIIKDVESIIQTMEYGYDLVSISRILENYDYRSIPTEYIENTQRITEYLRHSTGLDITDPLSDLKAYNINSFTEMELTEFSHAMYLQLLIQAVYYNLTIHEMPSAESLKFGREYEYYDDPVSYFLSIIESECFLYHKEDLH